MTDEELQARLLDWRGVEDPCLKCHGSGAIVYGSTATWRGGIGGQMMTRDVCDSCWGSGDRYRAWTDLRRLRGEESKRTAEQAVDLLARSVGASYSTTRANVVEILRVIEEFANKKRTHHMTRELARGLANTIRRAMGAPEVKP